MFYRYGNKDRVERSETKGRDGHSMKGQEPVTMIRCRTLVVGWLLTSVWCGLFPHVVKGACAAA